MPLTSSASRTPWLHPVPGPIPAWHLMTAVWDGPTDSWTDMRSITLVLRLTRSEHSWLVVRGLEQDPVVLEHLRSSDLPEAFHTAVLGVCELSGEPAQWTAQLARSPWGAELGLVAA